MCTLSRTKKCEDGSTVLLTASLILSHGPISGINITLTRFVLFQMISWLDPTKVTNIFYLSIMNIFTLFPSVYQFLLFSSVILSGPKVHGLRSSFSTDSFSTTGSSSSGTSLIPSTGSSHRHRERELISAQFRAVPSVERDLDTSEPSLSSNVDPIITSGFEHDSLGAHKYLASPSKMRLNRYSQTGFYDPYPGYMSVFPTGVPSTSYPFHAYTYMESNPILDTYPYYERDRIRQLRGRAMQGSQSSHPYSSSTSSNSGNHDNYSYDSSNYYQGSGSKEGYRGTGDTVVAEAGHGGHDNGASDHKHGWGKIYTSKVNTNAFGLLGLLGLLSLLSNVLLLFTTTTTTTAAMKRSLKRRSATEDPEGESVEGKRARIFKEVLKHLTSVAYAMDGEIHVKCTYHGVCMANKILVSELGILGRPAGQRISNAIVKLLWSRNKPSSLLSAAKEKNQYLEKNNSTCLRDNLEEAGLQGRNQIDCDKAFPKCKDIRGITVPLTIRMHNLPELIHKVSRLTKHGPGFKGKGIPMNL